MNSFSAGEIGTRIALLSHGMIIKKPKSKSECVAEEKAHQQCQPGDLISRREFFERGLLGLSSHLVVPSALSLLFKPNLAFTASPNLSKVFIMDFPGGAGFGSEVAFLQMDGTIPSGSSYFRTGAPVDRSVNTQFGAPIWTTGLLNQALTSNRGITITNAPSGNIFPGTVTPASGKVKQRLKIVVLQHGKSLDDVESNPTLGTQSIANAAVISQLNYKVKGGLQARSDANFGSGGFAQNSVSFPGLGPALATKMTELEKLFKLDQGALSTLSPTQLEAVANSSFSFSEKVKRTLGTQNRLAERALEGARNLQALAQNQPKLNFLNDYPAGAQERVFYNSIFQFEGTGVNINQQSRNLMMAANVKAVLDGLAPLAVFSENNQMYDYHDSLTTWQSQHHPLMIDQTIKILNAMAEKNQSGIVAWHTNGGITFDDQRRAVGDGSEYHSAVFFILSSGSSAEPTPRVFNLGGANSEGGAINDINRNILARSASYEAHALLANLLSLSGVPKSDFGRFRPANISLAEFQALSVFAA